MTACNLILFLYLASVVGFELYMCGAAASLLIEHYDTSVPVGNGTRVSIRSLPRDLYGDVKDSLCLLATFSFIGLCCWLVFIKMLRKKQQDDADAAMTIGMASSCVAPFGLSCYLMWKLNTLSDVDRDVWDAVDTGFVDFLILSIPLCVQTVVPALAILYTLIYLDCSRRRH